MPDSAFILRNTAVPTANKLQWLTVDLSTARDNVSLGISGIGLATHTDYITDAQFTLKPVFKDDSEIILSQTDMAKISSFAVDFKDIKITNIIQVGKTAKFLIIQHIPVGG